MLEFAAGVNTDLDWELPVTMGQGNGRQGQKRVIKGVCYKTGGNRDTSRGMACGTTGGGPRTTSARSTDNPTAD